MLIGIDASRAFIKKRTGIEEYSYQVIKHLRNELKDAQVFLYLRKNQEVDFELPKNWIVKTINWPRLWTQGGLSLEMLFHPVDTLFIPAHTVPWIHPKNTVVTIHGLEYEFCPEAYSFWEKIYMRWSIKNSCQWAKKIIAVSNNTKQDLVKLYGVNAEKIRVIYEGYDLEKSQIRNNKSEINSKFKIQNSKFLLFIGRLEERKNIIGIISAFEIIKEKYKIPHKLVLAGKGGFGYQEIKKHLSHSSYLSDIIELGFVSEEEKWNLLKNAEVFLFPTLYEGFGLPILEAQSVGVPVVTSNVSSMPEVVGCHCEERSDVAISANITRSPHALQSFAMTSLCSALLINPKNPSAISEAVQKILSNENLKKDLIQKGLENVQRFSWGKCAEEISEIILNVV